jgi:glycosyltransferase involved in cell wall biosynthesis
MHAIVANGFAEGPAQALRDYLLARDADVLTIFHPLTPEQGTRHVVTRYERGRQVAKHVVDIRVRPPWSYVVDPLVPLLPPRVDTWFGFNPLAAARGLVARGLGRASRVVLWSVDFVPDRFGAGTLPTRLYDRLDRLCCMRADARVELSSAAREARDERHDIHNGVPVHLVPMGAWLDRVPQAAADGYATRRVVFLGHLVPRQGVDLLLDALALLNGVSADVIGTGPLEHDLRSRGATLGLSETVRFHGFVEDHREVERLLAEAALGIAPYREEADSFTRYADPGKLKAYLAAGLPVVLTPVPPNADELAREAGAELVDGTPEALAEGIGSGLADDERWRGRRSAALAYVKRFDWEVLLSRLLDELSVPAR